MKSRVTPFRHTRGTLLRLLPAGLLLLAACGEDHLKTYPQTTFSPVTEMGRTQIGLFNLTLYLGVAVGIVTFALMAYICLRFRYRPGAPEPEQIHGNTRLEIAWTLVPALILAVIAIPTVKAIFETQPPPPANALYVDAIGKQWWWEFKYLAPNGRDTVVTANEIHVPVGRPVVLRLHSDNVLHSFWVPQMGGKRDMITNRVNTLIFTPGEPGVYLGQCAEFCGDSHALMKMRMIAHDEPGFTAWLQNEAAPAVAPLDSTSAVAVGQKVVVQKCATCHAVRGVQGAAGPMANRTGPNLSHFGRRRTVAGGIMENNAQNLAAWLRDPPAVKPGSKMPDLGLSEDEIRYITAYLQSLQ